MTTSRVAQMCLVSLAALTACRRQEAPADSAAVGHSSAAVAADWVRELGPVLVVPGEAEGTALVLHADARDSAAAVPLRLMRPGGTFAEPVRTRTTEADSLACGDASLLQLSGAAPAGWTIGLASRDVAPVRLDSIESLSASDSSSLAADVARAASALASADSRFRGLPFVVLKAHRITHGDQSTLVATVLRRIPQEATPLEERIFVIAEGRAGGSYTPAYHLKSEGSEESTEHYALLGVVQVGQRQFALVEREQETGTRYEVLERVAREWRLRWSRTLTC